MPKQPVSMKMTIDSANEALRYWLTNAMFQDTVYISTVEWSPDEKLFLVTFRDAGDNDD